jgi:hypothetical protein
MVTSGLQIQQEIGGSGLKGAVIGNSSNLQATIIMQGAGISRTLYPYTVDFFDAPHDASGGSRAWSGNLVIKFATGLADTGAYVQVDTIGANEPFKNAYPISLSRGMVNTTVVSTSANTLTNETETSGTLIVDIGIPGNTDLIDIYNNGALAIYVLQSGTPHLCMVTRTLGKPVAFGQTGDHVEIIGILDIDQNLFVVGTTQLDNGNIATDGNGALTIPNGIYYKSKDSGGTARNLIRINSINEVEIKGVAGTDKVDFQTGAGLGIAHIDTTGITIEGSAKFNYIQGSLSAVGDFSGTGNATVNTNVTNPSGIAFDPCTVSGSSQTIGGTIASSSVVTTGAGLAWHGWSYRG